MLVCDREKLAKVPDMSERVYIALERDESGYPPWEEEVLRACSEGFGDRFRIKSSPTFVRGLSYGDVVHVVSVGERRYVDEVLSSAGHSTVRVVLFKDDAHDSLIALGPALGCDVDHTEIQGLFSIDVPPAVSFSPLISALKRGQLEGLWDFEEANISVEHQAGPR